MAPEDNFADWTTAGEDNHNEGQQQQQQQQHHQQQQQQQFNTHRASFGNTPVGAYQSSYANAVAPKSRSSHNDNGVSFGDAGGYSNNNNTSSASAYTSAYQYGGPMPGSDISGNYGGGGGGGGGFGVVNLMDDAPQCGCGNQAVLCTSRQERTNGLQFYACAQSRTSELYCGFFQWVNPEEVPAGMNSSGSGGTGFVVPAGSGMKDHVFEIRERFGHIGFRQGQKECVEAALAGRDVFCLMPTGGGKSVVYQVPANVVCI
jgi:hypothetical protein